MEGCATNASALSPFLLAETAASGEGGRAGAADAPSGAAAQGGGHTADPMLPERGVATVVDAEGEGTALLLRSLSLATPDGSRTLFRNVSARVAVARLVHTAVGPV